MRPKEKQFGKKVKQKAMNLADPRIMQIAAVSGNVAGVLEIPNKPGWIYALSRGSRGSAIVYEVLNEVGDIPPHHPIIIGTLASDPNTMRVIKVQDVFWEKLEPRVKPHAKEHGVGGTDPLPIKLEQWMWFKIEPAPDEGPFHVAIYRYSFVTDSDVVLPPSTEYLDLATHVPTSGALFVLIEILADGTINVVDGTPVTQRQDLAESDIPLPTSGARRLYAVSLYAGQTRVGIKRDWNDFYDLRLSDLGSGGGGSGTVESVTGSPSGAVDNTDPANPIVVWPTPADIGAESDLGFTPENVANKSIDVNADQASNTKYPSVKAVYDWVISLGYQVALTAVNFGDFLIGLAAKTVPVDADSILISSAADGDDVKKTTLTQFKAFLKTYFDTIYVALGWDGWSAAGGTWTYSSTDDPTGVITSNVDETGSIGVGDRIKFVNAGNTIYGKVTSIAFAAGTTTIKFCHQIDPSDNLALILMANSAITVPKFSHAFSPYGFPNSRTAWRILITDTSNRSQSSPSTTIYNLGSLLIDVPIGEWILSSFSVSEAEVNLATTQNRSVRTGLSTANNTFSDLELYVIVFLTTPALSTATARAGIALSKLLSLTSKTRYYLNCAAGGATAPTSISFRGDLATTRIMAELAY